MRIALLGDIALIGRYDRTVTNDVDNRIDVIKSIVSDCDYVIANLESPLTTVQSTIACKGVYLRSDPVNVATLSQIGVTHVTLANNHIFDYGKKGAFETIKTLNQAGIMYVGLNNPAVKLSKENSTVLLDGFCCLSANALRYGTKSDHVKTLTDETMEAFLKEARREDALPIASVHFGIEGLHYPSDEHMHFFRSYAEKYKYILHGNHPHAIQGYETWNQSLLIYSHGNLCFDETPITSIHNIPKETDEERKCFISILQIEKNNIVSHTTIPLSDLPDGKLRVAPETGTELKKYISALREPAKEIQNRRDSEKQFQRTALQQKDLRFFLDRMNYKYIGAYLNGKKHARQYSTIIGKYKTIN